MSMTAGMRRVSGAELESLLALEAAVTEFDEEDYAEDLADNEASLDLDKAWHGLHYLLTETADGGEAPFCYLAHGGKVISNYEGGYERLLVPDEVAALDNALSELSPDDLRPKFNPQTMMAKGVYPAIWDRDPQQDDTLGWLLEFYAELRTFVREAAANGQGIVVDLSV